MPYENLADFVSDLKDSGELVRVSAEVDADLEIAAITDHASRSDGGGPALLFENVKQSVLPVAVNLLGSQRRMCRALGVDDVEEVANRLAGLIRPALPEGWLERLKLLPQFSQLANLPPNNVNTGLCQQVVKVGRDIDLAELPPLRFRPQESAPFITRGQVHTQNPQTGTRSVENVPLEIAGPSSLLVHWTPHDLGYQNFQKTRQLGRQTPVAVSLGGDPLLDFLCALPLPADSDPLVFGGFLRDKNLDIVACRSVELHVPAQAEIVLEGYVDASGEPQMSGAFGSRTGYYAPPAPQPVLHLTALTHRANPIFPATVYGQPPREEYWMNRAAQRIFRPLLKLFLPEIEDFHLPRSGGGRHICFVSIHKTFPQQARKVMNGIWSLKPLMYSKLVVVVDAAVDVHDEEQVWFQVASNVDPGRDILHTDGPADYLDHATLLAGAGQKIGIDATAKLAAEGRSRAWPPPLDLSRDIQELVRRRWSEYHIDLPGPPEQ